MKGEGEEIVSPDPSPSPSPSVVAVATDVGALRVLTPVIAELGRRGETVRTMLAKPAASFAEHEGIAHLALSGTSPDEDAEAVWRQEPGVLLLGTSVDQVVERALARHARESTRTHPRIPTVGVLDAMLFVELRFGPGLRDLPDVTACPDSEAAERLGQAGAGTDRLAVTGNPTLEAIAAVSNHASRDEVRDSASGPVDVLFVSQPAARTGRPASAFAIDERRSLDDLVAALGALADLAPSGFRVRVRWHPTQRPDRLPDSPRNIQIQADDDPDRLRSAARARIVIGMSSTLLAEARMLPRPAIAYLPGPYWKRELVYPPSQGVRRVATIEQLEASLAEALVDGPDPAPIHCHAGAASRIADLVIARRSPHWH